MLRRINYTLGRMEILGDLTSWDFGFMSSIRDQLVLGRTLSSNQEHHLHSIEGRWSDEAIAARAGWSGSWDDEKEQKFALALRYYQRTGYYASIVYKYLDHTTDERRGTPLEKEYNKLVNNKYAQGVIRNFQEKTKFPVGCAAVFNSKATHYLRNKPVVILKNCDELSFIKSHAKGAKPIQVLPIGSAEPVWPEERYLKKVKKQKKQ